MSKKKRKFANARRQRRRNISVRAIRRDQPDTRKLARAIVAIALAQAEAEAQAQAEAGHAPPDAGEQRSDAGDA